jgi:hypothetical protein
MQRLSLLVPLLVAMVNIASGQACSDIRSFDLRNATISSSSAGGSPGGHSVFHFRNGKAFIDDDSVSVNSQIHDWELEITSNVLIHPDSSTWLRVITFDRTHLTGTGTWNYVMAFTCKQQLIHVFEYSGLYLRLTHLDTQTLVLEQETRKKNDPYCCPTGRQPGSTQLFPRYETSPLPIELANQIPSQ